MPNIKISDLNKANHISDKALIVIVQDHANKTVTVEELANKINEGQDHLIEKLHDEIHKSSQGGNIIRLKNIAAKHEYILQKQGRDLNEINHQIGDIKRQYREDRKEFEKVKHFLKVAKKIEADNIITRKALTYTNSRVDTAIKDVNNLNNKISYLGDYVENIAEDCKDSSAYLAQYIHFDKSQYWGTLSTSIELK